MLDRFDYDACEHVQRFFPERCAALGKEATMEWVRDGLKRARGYGFESYYDLLRYLNLLFQFGDGFELSPAHAWALSFLESERPARVRMNLLMDEAYRRLFPAGPPAIQEDEAPGEFDGLVWEDIGVGADYIPTSIEPEIEYFPQRAAPGSVPTEDPDPLDIDEEDPVEDGLELDGPEEVYGGR
jgi:hypothetical protein